MDGVPVFRDYNVPAELRPRNNASKSLGWKEILAHWRLVVLDLSEVYGIHFETTDLPWPGIRDRITGLLGVEKSRLASALH